MSLNKNLVILAGRLTKDPEMRNTNSGKSVAEFTIAVNREYDRNTTDFINCSAFDKTAEFICKYFGKGSAICIEGAIRINKFEKDGKTSYFTNIIASKVDFVESAKSGEKTEETETYAPVADDDRLPF